MAPTNMAMGNVQFFRNLSIAISFIISKQKIGNYTYESLSNKSKQSILNIANNFLYIKENGYPKEEENIKEYQKQLKKTIKYFLHQN